MYDRFTAGRAAALTDLALPPHGAVIYRGWVIRLLPIAGAAYSVSSPDGKVSVRRATLGDAFAFVDDTAA